MTLLSMANYKICRFILRNLFGSKNYKFWRKDNTLYFIGYYFILSYDGIPKPFMLITSTSEKMGFQRIKEHAHIIYMFMKSRLCFWTRRSLFSLKAFTRSL